MGFEYDNDVINISWCDPVGVRWRMEISFDSLADRVVLVSSDTHLYLFVANQPKVYREVSTRVLHDNDNWERDVCFGSCSRQVIGHCSAVRLELDRKQTGNVDGLLQRLRMKRFVVFFGSPTVLPAGRRMTHGPRFRTFEANYAWYCLETRGFRVTDQLTGEVVDLFKRLADEGLAARLLYSIGEKFDDFCAANLRQGTVQRELEMLRRRAAENDDEDRRLEHLVEVRRLLLTPTVVRALPAEYIVGNRVVREFDVDRFVRVVLRDDDMELLTASAVAIDKLVS